MRTKAGELIPLTMGYRPDADEEIVRASHRISAILGRTDGNAAVESVQALVAAGRVIDAIKLLRESERLSLEEAKRRVDSLTRGERS